MCSDNAELTGPTRTGLWHGMCQRWVILSIRITFARSTAVRDTVAKVLVGGTRSEANQRLVFELRSGPPSVRPTVGSHGRPRATGYLHNLPEMPRLVHCRLLIKPL